MASTIPARDEMGSLLQRQKLAVKREAEGLYRFGLMNSEGWVRGANFIAPGGALIMLSSMPSGQSNWMPGSSEPVLSFVASDMYLDIFPSDPTLFRCIRVTRSELHSAILSAVVADPGVPQSD